MQYALLIYPKPGAAEALGTDAEPILAPSTMRKRVPTSHYRPR